MCAQCDQPRATIPRANICNRCGHEGTCWIIERPSWPSWVRERICYICIAQAVLVAGEMP